VPLSPEVIVPRRSRARAALAALGLLLGLALVIRWRVAVESERRARAVLDELERGIDETAAEIDRLIERIREVVPGSPILAKPVYRERLAAAVAEVVH
jgi:hypothetical protein